MRYLLLFSSFLFVLPSFAQSIPNEEFDWFPNESPALEIDSITCLFAKVENDPVLKQFSRSEFENFLAKAISEWSLSDEQEGVLKLKLNFLKNGQFFLASTGLKDIALNETQLNKLTSLFDNIHEFQCGKQMGEEVNCQGLLYVYIERGAFRRIHPVNFLFN